VKSDVLCSLGGRGGEGGERKRANRGEWVEGGAGNEEVWGRRKRVGKGGVEG